jgi:putative phage-type endonuclease
MIDESLIQGSEQWKLLRKSKVTASDIPVIMGISPYKKAKQLFLEKTDQAEEPEATEAMKYGNRMEPEARNYFCEQFHRDVYPCVKIKDWMLASIDGYCLKDKSIIVEIKCPYSLKIPESIPEHHYAQMQAQMYVSGVDLGIYFVYVPNQPYLAETVHYNAVYVEDFLERARVFYDCMMSKDFSTFEALDYDVKTDQEFSTMMEAYKHYSYEISILEDQKEKIRKEILSKCTRNTKSFGFKIEQRTRKGAIQYGDIPELKSIDLEQYRAKETVFWTITEDKGK